MDLNELPSIKIGDYTIYQVNDIHACIIKQESEGGHFLVADVVAMLDALWQIKF